MWYNLLRKFENMLKLFGNQIKQNQVLNRIAIILKFSFKVILS